MKKAKTIIFIALTIIWCGVIFSFSAQNSETSSDTSGSFIEKISSCIVPEFESFSGAEREDFVENLQFFVRKAAHFSAYCLLGLLAYQSLEPVKKKKLRALSAAIFALLYACSDEFHQSLVPGRSAEFRDVCIDFSGAVLGVALSVGISALISKSRMKPKDEF